MSFEVFDKRADRIRRAKASYVPGTGRPRQTHCQYGHLFNAENTYESPRPEGGKPMRQCKKCKSERARTGPEQEEER